MYRIGHGYDVHRFTQDRKLIIGGVEIEYEKGLYGHSDADVLSHALIDALLGAVGLGDIGSHFPDKDMKYKNINSLLLLEKTVIMIREKGYSLCNADCTIIAQEPKLALYIPLMREALANCIDCEPENINIKATTEEGLGFTGALQGISAHVVVLLKKV